MQIATTRIEKTNTVKLYTKYRNICILNSMINIFFKCLVKNIPSRNCQI